MNAENKVIKQANKWVGYLEKKNINNLDNFTANAGSNNYTCFARDYKRDTGLNLQAQPWCAIFVSELFVQAYGLEKAKKLLCGSLYHYCPTGVSQFKKAGRWHTSPQLGDVIFFTNGTRAYHTGLVAEVTSSRVKTIEGNTSGASGVIENGGGVCKKSYSLVESRILGYGRPDYAIVDTVETGWIRDQYGWWYRREDGSYPRNGWENINNKWYWFNESGYAFKSQWVKYKNKWYYLGQDNAMVTGLQILEGKLYYFNPSGDMVTEPINITLTPDSKGALR